ncbi:MAG: Lsm family RNA-binding protein [Candidatus Nezhaarchaeota archaeon]|nr:Lsm family RNA-binding protein [Candidatus Nezhaarchaeota archaeon]
MSIVSDAARKFVMELSSLMGRNVEVRTTQGRVYEGKLVAYDHTNLNLCLANAKDPEGRSLSRVFIAGGVVTEIIRKEEPFDLKGLAEALEKVFPKMVTFHEEANVITIMDRVRITEQGVVEGAGPIAERAKKVFEEFVSSKKASQPYAP